MSNAVAMMKGKQVLALTLVAIGSLTCFGFNSELCDFNDDCPSRIAYLVAAGVISFILTAVALAGLLLQIAALKRFMPFICGFLALWWGITAGVASSPRTYPYGTLNVGLLSVWLAFLAALVAAVGAAAEEGWISGHACGTRRSTVGGCRGGQGPGGQRVDRGRSSRAGTDARAGGGHGRLGAPCRSSRRRAVRGGSRRGGRWVGGGARDPSGAFDCWASVFSSNAAGAVWTQ
eukprot:TRINITY_DN2128_c0_g1_i5.p1 TRINITY_DN2128_c0_g1~~TRINITY_DN2128_c0_g1_i5.p1  ORF type:complete len:233 (-),score=36.46 TRINITY_DN2128_c0_g1_i5:128-826(-)